MNRKYAMMTAIGCLVMLLGVAMISDNVSADPAFDEDKGSFWSMAVTVWYNPPAESDPADSVTWDFGDGTAAVTVGPYESVRHVYPATGVYYITQTATNSVGSNTAVYKITILGYPVVTYVFGHDLNDAVVQQTGYNMSAGSVAIPELEGYEFAGWYKDSNLTDKYNFTGITMPTTLYAKWIEEGAPVDPVQPDEPENQGEKLTDMQIAEIAVGGVGALILVIGLALRRPDFILIGIIAVAAAAVLYFGVFS